MMGPMPLQALITQLRKLCGEKAVLSAPAQLAAYDSDGLSFHRYRPDCVVLPSQ